MTRTKTETQLSYPERLDIPQVTLTEAREQILLSLQSKQRRGCIVLVGESGLGKTQIFSQICREYGYGLNPIHTAHWGLMGSGIPKKSEGDFFDVAVPSIFPKKGQKSILLFDELNRGLKHAIAQFFTLLEDGRMFNYTLPEDCLVVGTMNPDTAAYAVTNIENEAAIRRRVKFLYVIPEFTGWYSHAQTEHFHAGSRGPAKGKACHPEVLKYFKANPKLLYDEKARDQGKQYVCPATVETISEDAYNMDAQKISLQSSFAHIRFAASIGVTSATQLVEYIKDHTAMLDATDILPNYNAKTRKIIQRLTKSGQEDKLACLCDNVLTLLYTDQPDVTVTAPNLLRFWNDIPADMTSNLVFQLRGAIAQLPGAKVRAKAQKYLEALMDELGEHKEWLAIIMTMDQAHIETDDSVRQSK